MKYVIYSDVDGTLYGKYKDKVIPQKNIEAIKKAKDLGVEFVIATGNGKFETIKDMCKKLGSRYLITSNGAGIYDFKKEEFIYKSAIPKTKALELSKIAKELEICASGWDEDNFFTNLERLPEELIAIYRKSSLGETKMNDISSIDGHLFKFEAFDTPEKVDVFMERIKHLNLQMIRMEPRHVETNHLGVSKGNAVQVLNKILGVKQDDFMTIGDSANDHSMLEISNHSYAMGNADQTTKTIAKFETLDAMDAGMAHAVEKFLREKKLIK